MLWEFRITSDKFLWDSGWDIQHKFIKYYLGSGDTVASNIDIVCSLRELTLVGKKEQWANEQEK